MKPFESIRPEVRQKTLQWARAELPNPVPGSIDFAAPNVTQGYLNRNPTARLLKRAGNWFLSDFGTEDWPADQVTIHSGNRVAGPSVSGFMNVVPIVGGVALGVAAIFAGWAYWEYGRG